MFKFSTSACFFTDNSDLQSVRLSVTLHVAVMTTVSIMLSSAADYVVDHDHVNIIGKSL